MDLAIIGAGLIGRLRAETVRRQPGTRLIAVADPNLSAAEGIARTAGARAFADHRALLQETRPEAVICSAPAHLHEAIGLDVLGAGAHLLCEKPLAISGESAGRLVAAASRAGRVLAVGFNHRYYPAFAFVKEVVDSGRIGTIDHVRAFGGHDGLANFRADWMYKSELSGGGAMMDVGLHLTDLVRFVVGDLARVRASTRNRVWKVPGSEDDAIALFESKSGIPVAYQATWNEWTGYEVALEVYGDRGMVSGSYAPMKNLLITQEKPGGPRRRERRFYPEIILREKFFGWQTTTRNTFAGELADFLGRIGGAATPLASGLDGQRSIEAAEAAYRSSRDGSVVELPAG